MADSQFSAGLFAFLRELRKHNNREWFLENKARYESAVRDPLLRFITDVYSCQLSKRHSQ